jgi:hypothetical protein
VGNVSPRQKKVKANNFFSQTITKFENGEQLATKKQRTANSTYKKLAVQWLNEALCFVSSSVLADSFVLRKRQLLVAANR